MRDYYTIPLGDGYIEHHDHGAVYYTRYGEDVEQCSECGELRDPDELDHDDICVNCRQVMAEDEEMEDEDGPG